MPSSSVIHPGTLSSRSVSALNASSAILDCGTAGFGEADRRFPRKSLSRRDAAVNDYIGKQTYDRNVSRSENLALQSERAQGDGQAGRMYVCKTSARSKRGYAWCGWVGGGVVPQQLTGEPAGDEQSRANAAPRARLLAARVSCRMDRGRRRERLGARSLICEWERETEGPCSNLRLRLRDHPLAPLTWHRATRLRSALRDRNIKARETIPCFSLLLLARPRDDVRGFLVPLF